MTKETFLLLFVLGAAALAVWVAQRLPGLAPRSFRAASVHLGLAVVIGSTLAPVLRIVPGHNYTLDQTLFFGRGHQVLYWGPYQISPDLWHRAVARTNFLATNYLDLRRRSGERPHLFRSIARKDMGGRIPATSYSICESRRAL